MILYPVNTLGVFLSFVCAELYYSLLFGRMGSGKIVELIQATCIEIFALLLLSL